MICYFIHKFTSPSMLFLSNFVNSSSDFIDFWLWWLDQQYYQLQSLSSCCNVRNEVPLPGSNLNFILQNPVLLWIAWAHRKTLDACGSGRISTSEEGSSTNQQEHCRVPICLWVKMLVVGSSLSSLTGAMKQPMNKKSEESHLKTDKFNGEPIWCY